MSNISRSGYAELKALQAALLTTTADMVLAGVQTITGVKTFLDGKMILRNVANTFNGVFTNTNTANRTYTLKDASGTIAFTSDITGTNSGVNTGDQTSIVGITGTIAQFNTACTDADFATGGGAVTGTSSGTNTGDQDLSGLLVKASNLSDLANAATARTNLSLGNVDNTSDVNKPVSTAQQTALDLKVDENAAITGATKTKITYDAKGLVTAGADATTADIADSSNKRYVTDAQLVVIGNTIGTNTGDQTNITGNAATVTTNANLTGHVTSVGNAAVLGSFTVAQLNAALSDGDVATGGGTATGTNTGDQTSIAGISGTMAQFDSACSNGDFMYVGVQFSGLAKITVGTSAPGSPTTGDLWCDTN